MDFPGKANVVDVSGMERKKSHTGMRECMELHTKKQNQIIFVGHGRC